MIDLVRVEFQCEVCGGTVLRVDDHPTNDTVVSCKQCGHVWGDFSRLKLEAVERALPSVLAQARQKLKK